MKRKLIFAEKISTYGRNRLQMEIENMEKLLPYIESYNTFETSNDIVDIRNYKFMTRSDKIRILLEEHLDCSTKYYVFCKN